MPTTTKAGVSGWTIDTLATHHEAIRLMQERLDAERDRRYAEVDVERERARQIKEVGDATALGLAREIQTYKDLQHNDLRKQIDSERGLYASVKDLIGLGDKFTAQLKPMNDFIAREGGHSSGSKDNQATIAWVVALIASLIAIGSFVFRAQPAAQPAPQMILVPAQPGTLIPTPSQQQQGPPR